MHAVQYFRKTKFSLPNTHRETISPARADYYAGYNVGFNVVIVGILFVFQVCRGLKIYKMLISVTYLPTFIDTRASATVHNYIGIITFYTLLIIVRNDC